MSFYYGNDFYFPRTVIGGIGGADPPMTGDAVSDNPTTGISGMGAETVAAAESSSAWAKAASGVIGASGASATTGAVSTAGWFSVLQFSQTQSVLPSAVVTAWQLVHATGGVWF